MDGLLQNASMTEKDIQFVNLPPDQMAPALARVTWMRPASGSHCWPG